MSAGLVRSQARRANRNLLIANTLLAGTAAAIFGVFQKELVGVATGPHVLDTQPLFQAADAGSVAQYYVTFRPEHLADSGLRRERTSKGSKSVKKYLLAAVGGKLLVIEAWDSYRGGEFTGFLTELPDEIRSRMNLPGLSQRPLFPVMLDVATPTFGYWIGITALAIPFLLGTWNVFNGLNRLMNIDRHPAIRRLSRHGDRDEVIATIDAEAADLTTTADLGGVTVTRNWLLRRKAFGLDAIRLEDLAWIYQKVVQHSTNGVPTGKTFAALLWDRGGRSWEITGKEPAVVQTLGEIAVRVPWVLVGYDESLEKEWKANRAAMLKVLDERRRIVEQGGPDAAAPAG